MCSRSVIIKRSTCKQHRRPRSTTSTSSIHITIVVFDHSVSSGRRVSSSFPLPPNREPTLEKTITDQARRITHPSIHFQTITATSRIQSGWKQTFQVHSKKQKSFSRTNFAPQGEYSWKFDESFSCVCLTFVLCLWFPFLFHPFSFRSVPHGQNPEAKQPTSEEKKKKEPAKVELIDLFSWCRVEGERL